MDHPGSGMVRELWWLWQCRFWYKYGQGWTCVFGIFRILGTPVSLPLELQGRTGVGGSGVSQNSGAVECWGQSSSVPLPERSWKGGKSQDEAFGRFRIGFGGGQVMDLGWR